MIAIKPFLAIIASIIFSGCHIGRPSYEAFKEGRDFFLIPTNSKIILRLENRREIYDENRYIYKFKGDDPRCIYGYLTNKDDKPEKVIGWIILSGKEYCKERQAWSLSF